jgi:hypothetical protein
VRRDVTTPDGVAWRVELDWIARRIANPVRRSIAATRRHKRDRGDPSSLGSSLDVLGPLADLPGPLGVLAALAFFVVLLVVTVVFIVWFVPLAVAITLVVFDFFYVTVAAAAVLVARVVLRRPWRVVARRIESEAGDVWTHEVVGYRASRRRVRDTADGLALGNPPADLGLIARPDD